jgi:hypothetical protein
MFIKVLTEKFENNDEVKSPIKFVEHANNIVAMGRVFELKMSEPFGFCLCVKNVVL